MFRNFYLAKKAFCIIKPQDIQQVPLSFKDFLNLTKFSLSNSNAILTSFCYCYIIDDYPTLYYTSLIYASSLTMAMSTQVFNQILEWKQDKVMTRTCNRPIPKRKISTFNALICGLLLFGISNTLLYFTQFEEQYFPIEALEVANAIFFGYVGIYNPLKRVTPLNTKIGAVVGALPVMLGAAAASQNMLNVISLIYQLFNLQAQSLSLFTFMFTWQFNHFYGIYWMYQKDYLRAGFKMLNDPKKAAIEMKIMCALGLATWFGVSSQCDPYLTLPIIGTGLYSMYKWNWLAIKRFETDPNAMSKQLKRNSYNYFGSFFLVALVDCGVKYAKKYQQQIEYQH